MYWTAALAGTMAAHLTGPEMWVVMLAVFGLTLTYPTAKVPLGVGLAYVAIVCAVNWQSWERSGAIHHLPLKLALIVTSVMLLSFLAFGLALVVRRLRPTA